MLIHPSLAFETVFAKKSHCSKHEILILSFFTVFSFICIAVRILGRMVFSLAGVSSTDAAIQMLESMRETEGRRWGQTWLPIGLMFDTSDCAGINTPSVVHVA